MSSQRNVVLFEIPQIEEYTKIHQPIVSELNKKVIKQKLDLEKQSLQKTKERKDVEDYFINFHKNPFSNISARRVVQNDFIGYSKSDKNKTHMKSINLLDEMVKTQQQRQLKPVLTEKIAMIDEQLLKTKMLSEKIVSNAKNLKYSFGKKQQKNLQSNPQEIQNNKIRNQTDIDSILRMKDQNFFLKNSGKINIFQYGLGEIYDRSHMLLEKYYFSWTSVIQKIQKIKVPIYRDLSRTGRRVILGLSTAKDDIVDYIDSYELSFKTNQLLFHDLMSVASGRFSADFVNKVTNEIDYATNKQASDTSSQQQAVNIFYRDIQKSQQIRFTNGNQQQQEIVDYLKLSNNKKQQIYENRCQQRKNYIDNSIKTMENLYRNTIKDRKLHSQLENKVQTQMHVFIKMDRKNQDLDRTIRMNKISKSKNQGIKLQKLLETMQLRNQHSKKMGRQQEVDSIEY